MSIPTFDRVLFETTLQNAVSPAQPIQSVQHLFGREEELQRIERSLVAHGRHVFIYGDRGVGKSSLAATAANQYQSADAEYIDVSGSPDATLNSIVATIAHKALGFSHVRKLKQTDRAGLDLKYLKLEHVTELTIPDLYAELRSIGDAVEMLREVAQIHAEKTMVVIDEFDRIISEEQRSLFADLLKQLGDKKIGIKFILTGVGRSLEKLLGAHPSAIRQLEPIELERLHWTGRFEIVNAALAEFGVSIPEDIRIRIAAMSDGYPYYVHLIVEHLLWRMFDDEQPVTEVTWVHLRGALAEAIRSVSPELTKPYNKAILHQSEDYEEILWSTADTEWLQRSLEDMYSSYEFIVRSRQIHKPLPYDKFTAKVRAFKKEEFGSILVSERARWYSYREKMLRGYVRMQSEAHGVPLTGESAAKGPKPQMHVPARHSTGYRASSIPRGVHQGRKRSDPEDEEDNENPD